MAPEIVNPIAVEDAPGWVRSMALAFLDDPDGDGTKRWLARSVEDWGDGSRAWGVRDRGRWVATLRTEPRRLALPGAGGDTEQLTVDALTNVTVAPTHRRRGLMAQMLGRSLAAARERGDALSILTAAEWGIYGRFGYAPMAYGIDYTLHRTRPGASIASADHTRVRQLDRAEFGVLAPELYERIRARRPGQIDRPDPWWPFELGLDDRGIDEETPRALLVHDGDDGPDGLLTWRTTADGAMLPPLGEVTVSDLAALDDRAYADLWGYLCGIDGVDRVVLADRPVDEPAQWLLANGRALVADQRVDHTWGKLLDVGAALRARRYAVAGELVLDVADDSRELTAGGRVALRADGERVQAEPTAARADIELDVRALAAIYLGGNRLAELAAAGLARELTSGALVRAEAMFATPRAPWNATDF